MEGLNPRPKQKEVLSYTQGYMGVSAVPGSGKTWTISVLASNLIAKGLVDAGQEVLIVTLVNSAVDNFSRRIGEFIEARGLLPRVGYRVRTLHGLARDIVRERPALVGLSDDFQIIDERAASQIIRDVSLTWMKGHPEGIDHFFAPHIEEKNYDWYKREVFPKLISDIGLAFIKNAKNYQMTPAQVVARMERSQIPLELAEMGLTIYEGYQQALNYRGMVDFDDLIRLALQAIQVDADFRERLCQRWPFILEDEAQDSSLLQENILRELAGSGGNWVRVGDPNQAIYETFTTANPKYLINFVNNEADYKRELPNSGRSSDLIINLANELTRWTREAHPRQEVRDALSEPYILSAPVGDPQPNPFGVPRGIQLVEEQFSPQAELNFVANSVEKWLEQNPDRTVAVLDPRNNRGFALVDILRQRGLEPVDSLLQASTTTRHTAGAVANILRYLSDPKNARRLGMVYKVWRREDREDEEKSRQLNRVIGMIEKMPRVEDFLHPQAGKDWLLDLEEEGVSLEILEQMADFAGMVRRWQGAVLLPIDQLVLTLAQDIFTSSTELAIAHKMAYVLGRSVRNLPAAGLPEMAEELAVIAKNERRFLGFSDDDLGFDPENYKGRVVVATMHKAKGLEWDRVYLMSVNNFSYPSGQEYDRYIGEKKYLRDRLNLQAEAMAQLDALISDDPYDWVETGKATEKDRLEYVRERLRLLYVGITRAKQELVITTNSGKDGDMSPALALVALQVFARENGYG